LVSTLVVIIMSDIFFSWRWPEMDHGFSELAAVTLLVLLVQKKLGGAGLYACVKIACWTRRLVPNSKAFSRDKSRVQEPIACVEAAELPSYPHVQMCVVPYSGELIWDGKLYNFENDMCIGSALALHRNTWDRSVDRKGHYFGYEFPGPAIKWEKRVQFRLKEPPKGTLMFGIELDEYVPVNDATRFAMKLIVGAMKMIVGNDLYHSVGEDPALTDNETEKPIFSMPMWCFDQFIETPEGEEPPSLTAPSFRNLGLRRSENGKEFTHKIANMKWKSGPTYTVSFWSISRLLDLALWKISGAFPGVAMSMDQFCGRAPVHIVIYDFQPSVANNRHVDSAKRYLFHLAIWSPEHPPPLSRLQQLMPTKKEVEVDSSSEEREDSKKFRGCCCCF